MTKLTQDEQTTMLHTGRGLTAVEIADIMMLNHKTVETYKCRGARKLGLTASEYRKAAFNRAAEVEHRDLRYEILDLKAKVALLELQLAAKRTVNCVSDVHIGDFIDGKKMRPDVQVPYSGQCTHGIPIGQSCDKCGRGIRTRGGR